MMNRMNELEATNCLLAKLDLNELVSLEKLEDRLQIEFARIEKNHFDRSILFENKIETFQNTVDEKASKMILSRTSKRDFNENNVHLMSMIREIRNMAQGAVAASNSLQTKYDNLDELNISRAEFEKYKDE